MTPTEGGRQEKRHKKWARELPFITSALEGGLGKADEVKEFSNGGCVKMRKRVKGAKISVNFADVINGRPQASEGNRQINGQQTPKKKE